MTSGRKVETVERETRIQEKETRERVLEVSENGGKEKGTDYHETLEKEISEKEKDLMMSTTEFGPVFDVLEENKRSLT